MQKPFAAGYCGRFAPTPSGPLHMGSVVVALAGWLRARRADGQWLLRFDDLDRQRCPPQHRDTITQQLLALGLGWDGPAILQSQRHAAYAEALAALHARGALYGCDCTRKRLQAQALPGPDGARYDGYCRDRQLPAAAALRLRVNADAVIHDARLGVVRRAADALSDHILWRDGEASYQLASVVDDIAYGVTDVVRGEDLVGSSMFQAHLMQRLGQSAPSFWHLPLVLDADGRKLSKQNHAPAVDITEPAAVLCDALGRLGVQVPPNLRAAAPKDVLAYALAA